MGKMIKHKHLLHSLSASIAKQRLIILLKENWIPAFPPSVATLLRRTGAGMTKNKIRIKHVIPRHDRGNESSFKDYIQIEIGFYGLV